MALASEAYAPLPSLGHLRAARRNSASAVQVAAYMSRHRLAAQNASSSPQNLSGAKHDRLRYSFTTRLCLCLRNRGFDFVWEQMVTQGVMAVGYLEMLAFCW